MQPQKHASVRYKSRPGTLVPFRDDAGLVALPYDQTAEAEPPIPIPPRSPLRCRISPIHRPNSTIATRVVIPTPCGPPPPPELHPALRLAQREGDVRRDSLGASTSRSPTFYEESESEGEDPFLYEKIESLCIAPLDPRRADPDLVVAPLRLRSSSLSSLYLAPDYEACSSFSGTNCGESQPSIPPPSPGLTDEARTASPTSPSTPPLTRFPEHRQTLSHARPKSNFFFSRALSLRSRPHPMRRLQKKHPATTMELPAAGDQLHADTTPPAIPSSPDASVAPPQDGETQLSAANTRPSSLDSPRLVKASGAADDFSNFVHHISFSQRGSIMLGGRRPSRRSDDADADDDADAAAAAAAARDMADTVAIEPPTGLRPARRALPLGPSLMPKSSVSESSAPAPVTVTVVEGDEPASPVSPVSSSAVSPKSSLPVTTTADASTTTPSPSPSPRTLRHTAGTRFVPIDVERESQKVRSLYEPEGLRWEDGGRDDERLTSTREEDSSDTGEIDASSASETPSSAPPVTQPGAPTPALGTPESAALTVPPPAEPLRRAYELAGGIEDWEDVQGEDVDRYGFIAPRRPITPASAPPGAFDSPVHFSPRRNRNVLTRKGSGLHSSFLGVRRPSRKMSARSLHTQASGVSTTSRMSTRSAFRQAANMLPHNRYRRWQEGASDMLVQQPGLSDMYGDARAEQLAEQYKQKEWERTEKWRKMAKVVKPERNGQGMIFEFDMNNPKLIERTWKGIPDRWRAAAWYSFLATSARNSTKTLATEEELVIKFRVLQYQPSSDDVQIDLDVPRTISQHIMFRKRYRGGQRLLFRVLHAVSLYFPETGYVQGMASLAATLLSYYDEEKCFIMLVRMWELRGLNRLYQPSFAELIEALQEFEKYWLDGKPVARSLKELCIDPTAYGTRWYLTLFNLSIPFSSQLRVWDVFMLLGDSPPALPDPKPDSEKNTTPTILSSRGLEVVHATSTAIILALNDHIVDAEFENAMKALTSFVPVKNDDLLMKVVRGEYKQFLVKLKKL